MQPLLGGEHRANEYLKTLLYMYVFKLKFNRQDQPA